MNNPRWFSEKLHSAVQVSYKADSVVLSLETPLQQINLIDNDQFGRMLLLDGVVQVTSADEFSYHEMLAHVPILGHGEARDVLIIGGGDCGLAEEVLKHASVRTLRQVEIDASVVDLARAHFSEFNAPVFADQRFVLEIANGARFVHETELDFDVVLVDSTDPVGPGAELFTADFYRGVSRCLRPNGILAAQSGVPFLQQASYVSAVSALANAFPVVSCYLTAVPSYFGGHMALNWASERDDALRIDLHTLERRFEEAAIQTRYYTPEVHAASFALPRYVRDAFQQGRAKVLGRV